MTVSLGTASAEARAGADGHWRATLPAMTAGGPYTLTATRERRDPQRERRARRRRLPLRRPVEHGVQPAAGATGRPKTPAPRPTRRSATSPSRRRQRDAASARSRAVCAGSSAAPETVGSFSAACYYFARELKKTVNVPIGLVNASYGGARLRTFMSEAALRKLGLENDDLDILDLYRTDPAAAMRRWGAQWESWWNDGAAQGRPAVAAGVRRRVVEDRAAGARRVGAVERHQPGRLHRPDVDAHDRHAHRRTRRRSPTRRSISVPSTRKTRPG